DVHKWKVVMGATDLSQPGREAEVFQIQRILKHERYDIGSERNNIALLELEQPVECSDYIQLGCVPDGSLAVPELKTCYTAGWRGSAGSAPSRRPSGASGRRAEPFRADPAGSAAPEGLARPGPGWQQPLTPSLPAQGDSGGPLVCKDNVGDYFWLVGLASWGRGCAGAKRPGVFTSTQHFHAWIRAHAGPGLAAPTP
ncbi:ACRO protein, partial [Hirundo rustica]|nr:ACRO protein [Hirundo rustica]